MRKDVKAIIGIFIAVAMLVTSILPYMATDAALEGNDDIQPFSSYIEAIANEYDLDQLPEDPAPVPSTEEPASNVDDPSDNIYVPVEENEEIDDYDGYRDEPKDISDFINVESINLFVYDEEGNRVYIIQDIETTGEPLSSNEEVFIEIEWETNELTNVVQTDVFTFSLPWNVMSFSETDAPVFEELDNGTIRTTVQWEVEENEDLFVEIRGEADGSPELDGTVQVPGITGDFAGLEEEFVQFEIAGFSFIVPLSQFATRTVRNMNPRINSPSARLRRVDIPKWIEDTTVNPNHSDRHRPIRTWASAVGVPFAQIQGMMEFSIYFLGRATSTNDAIIRNFNPNNPPAGSYRGTVGLTNDGNISFQPTERGWYAIVERYTEEGASFFSVPAGRTDPAMFIQVSQIGVSSAISDEYRNARAQVVWTDGIAHPLAVYFNTPYGCRLTGRKPTFPIPVQSDGRGNNHIIYNPRGHEIATAGFYTIINGVPYNSMCADLGAVRHDWTVGFDGPGAPPIYYRFDETNHYFSLEEVDFLVAALDYIHQRGFNLQGRFQDGQGGNIQAPALGNAGFRYSNVGTIREGRSLAQIVLWNLIIYNKYQNPAGNLGDIFPDLAGHWWDALNLQYYYSTFDTNATGGGTHNERASQNRALLGMENYRAAITVDHRNGVWQNRIEHRQPNGTWVNVPVINRNTGETGPGHRNMPIPWLIQGIGPGESRATTTPHGRHPANIPFSPDRQNRQESNRWFNDTMGTLVANILGFGPNPIDVIDVYNRRMDGTLARPNPEYVTGAMFLVGNLGHTHSYRQQRQLVYFFNDGNQQLRFTNQFRPATQGWSEIPLRKDLVAQASPDVLQREIAAGRTFTFRATETNATGGPITGRSPRIHTTTVPLADLVAGSNSVVTRIHIPNLPIPNAQTTWTYFTVTEDQPASPISGWTFDTTSFRVRIGITRHQGIPGFTQQVQILNNAGAWVNLTNNNRHTFTNRYTPNPTSMVFDGTKVTTGRALTANQFSFILERNMGTTGSPNWQRVGNPVMNTASGTFAFPSVEFTTAGTFQFRIRELGPDGVNPAGPGNLTDRGWTYDTTIHTINVTVTDVNGSLQATRQVVGGGNVVFTNKYEPAPTQFNLTGNKAVLGWTGQANQMPEFTINLERQVGSNFVPEGTLQTRAGQFTFANIPLLTAGTHVFRVTETVGTAAGWTYDTTAFTVTVVVTDNGVGQLVAGAPEVRVATTVRPGGVEFTNRYQVTDASLALTILKQVEGINAGSPLVNAMNFQFEAVETTGMNVPPIASARRASTTVTGATSATLTIPNLAVAENNAAATTYWRITELRSGQVDGQWRYSEAVYWIQVETTANLDGTATARIVNRTPAAGTFAENQFVFTNTFTPGPVPHSVTGTKAITGINWADIPEGNVFAFTATPIQVPFTGTPTPIGEAIHATVNPSLVTGDPATFSFNFGNLNEGTYAFLIQETLDNWDGWTFTPVQYVYTFTVANNMQSGALEITNRSLVSRANRTATNWTNATLGNVVFTNDYLPSPEYVSFEGVKQTVGFPLNEGQFTFVLERNIGTAGAPNWVRVGAPVTNTAPGATGEARFLASFGFDNILIDTAGWHYFRILELGHDGNPVSSANNPHNGWTFDNSVFEVDVYVYDNFEGKLLEDLAARVYRGPRTDVKFINTFDPGDTDLPLDITKFIEGLDALAEYPQDAEFTFEAVQVANLAGAALTGGRTIPGSRAITINEFGTAQQILTIDQLAPNSDGSNSVTYWLIREINTGQTGWNYSSDTFVIEITTSTDGVGGISAVITNRAGDFATGSTDIVFTNDFTPEKIQVPISGLKIANALVVGPTPVSRTFTFALYEQDTTVPGGWARVATTTSTVATGSQNGFSFPADLIEFEEAGIRTFRIVELGPDGTNPVGPGNNFADGWTFDATAFTFSVQATIANGALTAVVVYGLPDGGGLVVVNPEDYTPTFTNTYNADPIEVAIQGTKVAVGRILDQNFTFLIDRQVGGAWVPELGIDGMPRTATAVNTDPVNAPRSGGFAFANLEITTAGTHSFRITEVDAGFGGWEFDNRHIVVAITIEDNGFGELIETGRTVTRYTPIPGGSGYTSEVITTGIRFTNKYEVDETHLDLTINKFLTGINPANVIANRDFLIEAFSVTGLGAQPIGAAAFTTTITGQGQGTLRIDNLQAGEMGAPSITYWLIRESRLTEGWDANDNGTWVYSTAEYWIQITTTDDGQGNSVAAITGRNPATTGSNNAFDFTNNFIPAPIPVEFDMDKVLTGINWTDTTRTFTFNAVEIDSSNNFIGTPIQRVITSTAIDASPSTVLTFEFGDFAVGRYTFLVWETIGEEESAGWTYDTNQFRVVIDVFNDTVNGVLDFEVYNITKVSTDGTLTPVDSIVFTNAFDDETNIPANLVGNKTFTGDVPTDSTTDFVFEARLVGAVGSTTPLNTTVFTDTITSDGGEDELFNITVTGLTVGTHVFMITERDLNYENGWVTDDTVFWATIRVVDTAEGLIVFSTNYFGPDGNTITEVEFVNYMPEPINIEFDGTKVITGINWQDTTRGFVFEALHLSSTDSRIVFDPNPQVSTVDPTAIDQTNETLFSFAFEGLTYGQHVFRVTEVDQTSDGWSYDSNSFLVVVNVFNTAYGTFDYTVNFFLETDGDPVQVDEIVFTNDFDDETEIPVVLQGNKTFTGDVPAATTTDFVFEARLVGAVGSTTPLNTAVFTDTITSDGSEDALFAITIPGLTVGTHVFMITETDLSYENGWETDANVFWARVRVVDTPGGLTTYLMGSTTAVWYPLDALGNTVTGATQQDTIEYFVAEFDEDGDIVGSTPIVGVEFTNNMPEPITVGFDGTKVITGIDWEDTTRGFVFEALHIQSTDPRVSFTPNPQVSVVEPTAIDETNEVQFSFEFEGLTYGQHAFRVTEVDQTSAGWTYDGTVFVVIINVFNIGSGNFGYSVNFFDYNAGTPVQVDGIVFTNEFDEEEAIPVTLQGVKAFEGGLLPTDVAGTFTFEAVRVAEVGSLVAINSNVYTDTLTFPTADTQFNIVVPDVTVGTHVFKITEAVDADMVSNGWEFDPSVYWAVVRVVDTPDGLALFMEVAGTQYFTLDGTNQDFIQYYLGVFDATGALVETVELPTTDLDVVTFTNTIIPELRTEVHIDTIQRTSAAFVDLFHETDPNADEAIDNVSDREQFRYDVNFRSTSNVWADSFIVNVPLENSNPGERHLNLEAFWTPVVYGSLSGRYDMYINVLNENTNRSRTITLRDLSTSARQLILVYDDALGAYGIYANSRLDLDNAEFITDITMNFGAVDVGFTSLNTPHLYGYSLNEEHRVASNDEITLPDHIDADFARIPTAGDEPVWAWAAGGTNDEVVWSGVPNSIQTTRATTFGIATGIDWTPSSDRIDWSPDAYAASGLSGLIFLVAAEEMFIDDEVFIKSVDATISRDFGAPVRRNILQTFGIAPMNTNLGAFTISHSDQDAVVTEVIVPFGAEGPIPQPEVPTSRLSRGRADAQQASPRTGDEMNRALLLYAILGVLALGTAVGVAVKRKNDKKYKITIMGLLLAFMLVVPSLGVSAAPITPDEIATTTAVGDTITVVYRFHADQRGALVIPDIRTFEGRTFTLSSISTPAPVAGMDPADRVISVVRSWEDHPELRNLPSNCVNQLAEEHILGDNVLERATVTWDVTRQAGLPVAYSAVVSYRAIVQVSGVTITATYTAAGSIPVPPIPAPPTPTPTPTPGTPDAPVAPDADDVDVVDDVVDEEIIDTPDVPLAPAETVVVEDDLDDDVEEFDFSFIEDVPLAPGVAGSWGLLNLIFSIGAIILAAALWLTWFQRKNRADFNQNAPWIWGWVSIIPAVIAIIVFGITQDLAMPMNVVDSWTILFAIVLLAQVGILVLGSKQQESPVAEATDVSEPTDL